MVLRFVQLVCVAVTVFVLLLCGVALLGFPRRAASDASLSPPMQTLSLYFPSSAFRDQNELASFYGRALSELGWIQSCANGMSCGFNVTDIAFLGVYRFGEGEEAPRIAVGVNMMIERGYQVTFMLQNCGLDLPPERQEPCRIFRELRNRSPIE